MVDSQAIIMSSLKSLSQWIDREGPTGWDPYDALNSQWNKKLKNHYLRVALIQANKYSPFNLRPFFQTKKGIDLKGTALLTQAYAKLYRITQDDSYLNKVAEGLGFLEKKSLKWKYGYDCWASHYFPYVAADKNRLENDIPDVIGTSHSIIALIEGYKLFRDPKFLDMATSASGFMTDILYQETDPFPYFKYAISEVTEEIVPNASAHALEALTSILQIYDDNSIMDICEKTVQALIKIQRNDGSWFYSLYPNGEQKRIQLDFHQGYMIDGLLSFLPFSENKTQIQTCIEKGGHFYKNVLFRRDGSSYYRYPYPYPIDIHNQSQGIITFSKMSNYDRKYLDIAKKIAFWTIHNMQDRSGYYYYQKWPIIINKIPHIRWGQAWMMLALTLFFETGAIVND